jgi:superkiller protein 3
MKSRFSLILLLTLSFSAAVCAQNERHKLEQVRNHYETARNFERLGNWAEAEKTWRAVLVLAAADARAWTNLGVALNRQNKVVEALEAWNKAIAIDPQLAGAYFNIGLTLVRKGDYANAIPPLRRTLLIEPDYGGARRALAVALIGTEELQEATVEITRLLARSPEDPGLLELAARTLLQQRRYTEAVIIFQRRLRLPDTTSMLWAQYGDALDGAARTPEAAEAYRKAVALDPASTLVRYGLGYLYWKLYRYDDAERELIEVLRRDSKDPRAAFTLGDLYLTRGDAPRSLPLLEAAAAAYPNEFDTRFALGRALTSTGNIDRGIEELRAAVRLDDTIADGHFQLGRALIRSGVDVEGKQELEKARTLNEKRRAGEAERLRKKFP